MENMKTGEALAILYELAKQIASTDKEVEALLIAHDFIVNNPDFDDGE